MIDLIRSINPDFKEIEEAPVYLNSQVVGWHSHIMNQSGVAVAGGCASEKPIARRIAVAELVERHVFDQLVANNLKNFNLELFPTTCGFAAGFESKPTMMRSMCEAVERWAVAKWADEELYLDQVYLDSEELSQLSISLLNEFERVLFFKKTFNVNFQNSSLELTFGAAVGLSGTGAFLGTRVCSVHESPWEHGLIEAWRHLGMYKKAKKNIRTDDLYLNRVLYFGNHAEAFLSKMNQKSENFNWPTPVLQFLKPVQAYVPEGFYVWRGLCHDYIPWHLGSETRFVY